VVSTRLLRVVATGYPDSLSTPTRCHGRGRSENRLVTYIQWHIRHRRRIYGSATAYVPLNGGDRQVFGKPMPRRRHNSVRASTRSTVDDGVRTARNASASTAASVAMSAHSARPTASASTSHVALSSKYCGPPPSHAVPEPAVVGRVDAGQPIVVDADAPDDVVGDALVPSASRSGHSAEPAGTQVDGRSLEEVSDAFVGHQFRLRSYVSDSPSARTAVSRGQRNGYEFVELDPQPVGLTGPSWAAA